jgi:signal peptidase
MTVIRRAIDVALALLVVAVVAVGLAANLAPQAGSRLFAIRTGSMEPTMPVGSLVVATAVDPGRLAVGDIVTVQLDGGSTLTHRISAVVEREDGPMFELKGDANPVHDPVLVVADRVVGRVDLALPFLGYLLAMLSMPTGIAALLSIGGTLLTAGWLLDELTDAEADEDLAAERAERERLDATNVGGSDVTAWSEDGFDGSSELAYEGGVPR